MNDSALHITLGHNSSAILTENGRVVRGYEQERLDRKKSSSAYPRDAIDRCLANLGGVDTVYVSHWFDDMILRTNKYVDVDHLLSLAPRFIPLTESFTHHDAHASSVGAFFRANNHPVADVDIIVLDGFGNRQECFSTYQNHWPYHTFPRLTHRTHGYAVSLGLMYQYTTEYLGLRPNRDEYKLLGYESHVLDYVSRDYLLHVTDLVTEQAVRHANIMLDATVQPAAVTGQLIDYEALAIAKSRWFERADRWRKLFDTDMSTDGVRACVAFCAQRFLEEAVLHLIRHSVLSNSFRPSTLLLAGGCFYNVKLNRRIQVETGRPVFAHPLSGDQGAALGFTPGVSPVGLDWGVRTIGRRDQLPPGVLVCDRSNWATTAAELLTDDKIVNVVRGAMEFGPRALCNTTTFAMPTPENVALINAINERNEVMPMAPVMTEQKAQSLFRHEELYGIHTANRFMITTLAFKSTPPLNIQGIAHPDPMRELWTARPQIASGELEAFVHSVGGVLINTSFNYHGEPIVFTEDDACRTHDMQSFRAKTLGIEPPITLLVRS